MTEARNEPKGHRFQKLITAEFESLGIAPGGRNDWSIEDEGFEPFVASNRDDVVGLAFSGGGIRSATFCLGVLQGLRRHGLLACFDYHATVSGGGYIGAWWSAYRKRVAPGADADAQAPKNFGPPFPHAARDGVEPAAIRHLREFSNFLSPRWGLFETSTWQLLASVVASALPSLAVALSLMTLAVGGWLVLLEGSLLHGGQALAVRTAGGTALVLFWFELFFYWRNRPLATRPDEFEAYAPFDAVAYALSALVASGVVLLTGDWFRGAALDPTTVQSLRNARETVPIAKLLAWLPLGAWAAGGVSLIAIRTAVSRFIARSTGGLSALRSATDRVVGRLLALSVAWLIGVVIVWVADLLDGAQLASLLSIGGTGAGGAFVLINRFWSGARIRSQTGSVFDLVKRAAPMLLAYVAVAAALVGAMYLALHNAPLLEWPAVYLAAVAALVLSLVLFQPNEVGLHVFYRDRLARAYLGASKQESQEDDDMMIGELPADRPLQLVCCAANDLGSRDLKTLHRGARSATLSRIGFSVGFLAADWPKDRKSSMSLASAVTASAAAFNSNMGSLSLALGSAATFLMAAFNLRLGYWVDRRRLETDKRRRAVGWPFFLEMFGLTHADSDSKEFHLSDGGHFDNTALYELLRRRCRYILACDCGADRGARFDDLGNALRRAREDFDVEVEIDLTPLRPDANGISAQHVAVGEIVYPNRERGVILLLKPTLVGDEPDDVLQYHARNPEFPHESTGDQFYDEKQWESYRRLGQHAAHVAFGFLARDTAEPEPEDRAGALRLARRAFGGARFQWYPAPDGLRERVAEHADELTAIERDLAAIDWVDLHRQVYLELRGGAVPAREHTSPQRLAQALSIFSRILQLMENVYGSCDLERLGGHPLNMGWMNVFGRWATTPLLRSWWPVLAPMYNSDFVAFAERHFHLPSVRARRDDPAALRSAIVRHAPAVPVASIIREQFAGPADDGLEVYRFVLELPDTGIPGDAVEVAVALLQRGAEGKFIWKAEDFFVPPSFWGSGIGSRFLHELIRHLADVEGGRWIHVNVAESTRRDELARKEHADLVQMYREHGFIVLSQQRVEGRAADVARTVMELDLRPTRSQSTIAP